MELIEYKPRLNPRQQLYKKYRISGMNAYQSAVKAGYSKNTAVHAYENIEKRLNFNQILIQEGLDDRYLMRVVKEGVDVRSSLTGQPTLVTKTFVELACKLSGRLKEKVEHTGKDGIALPTPIINIYGSRNSTNQSICSEQSNTSPRESRI